MLIRDSAERVGERYEVAHLLGAGSYGTVYAAYDPVRVGHVALKRLRQSDAKSLYRFKKEFRALSRMSHPNLVALHELFVSDGDWYLAMELVEGVPLVDFFGGAGLAATTRASSTLDQTLDATGAELAFPVVTSGTHLTEDLRAATAHPAAEGGTPVERDWEAVRGVFAQVARALAALHAEGMLHRDLKPHNVLVTPTGRAVVLDFGLVTELGPRGADAAGGTVVGTPLYMAPEQATGRPAGPRSDVYALGVMLYEVLTGALPYVHENVLTLLWSKIQGGAPGPRELNPAVPEDLADLCQDLLAVDPDERPDAAAVMARLTRLDAPRAFAVADAGRAFVGREPELASLREAFARCRDGGEPVVALVEGESGMGKTALIERLLDEVAFRDGAFILRGRCYEQDFVPYKTVDAVVDELSSYLGAQSGPRAAALLPAHARELARLFPVFGQALDAGSSALLEPLVDDPFVAKRRGFGALRELLFRITREGPVVAFIDDVQWGDAESADVLVDLMRAPAAPPVFWAVVFRGDERATSPFLRALLARLAAEPDVARQHLPLTGLPPEAAAALVAQLLPTEGAGSQLAARIAHEGAGHPLFIEELARHADETTGPWLTASVGSTPDSADRQLLLAEVLRRRVADLSPEARTLLELVSVAGVPLHPRVAGRAAGSESVDHLSVARLRASKLLRTRQAGDQELLVPYHDRIRAAVVDAIEAPRLAAHHGALAASLEAASAPARTLVTHFSEAGDHARAAHHARRAGDEAAAVLAFHEAAELYGRALAWDPGANLAVTRATTKKRAAALINLGRCKEGAAIYAQLAEGALDAEEALDLELRAAQGYFTCAAMTEGEPLLHRATRRVGLSVPRSTTMINASVFARLGRIWLRSDSFRERPAEAVPANIARRIEVCSALGHSLTMPDLMRSLYFYLDAYELALKVGDARHAVDGLAMIGMFLSNLGWKQADGALARASALAAAEGTPEALGITAYARGVAAFLNDDWSTGLVEQEAAVRHLSRGRNVSAPRQASQVLVATNLRYLERFEALLRCTEQSMAEARDVGNPFAEAAAYVDAGFAHLGLGRPDLAREHRERAQALSSDTDMYVEFAGLTLSTRTDLYLGDMNGAHARMEQQWPRLKRAGLLMLPVGREFYGWLRAAAGVGRAAEATGREAAAVRKLARKVVAKNLGARPRTAFGAANRLAVLAACEHQEGNAAAASAMLEDAAAGYASAGLELRVAAARLTRAAVLGDHAAVDEARAVLAALDVADPSLFTRSVLPGFPVVPSRADADAFHAP
ncbi:MAG: protein kinase [Sandaracinaceae bacterium]|nr:protein kinase [Sandaracinaceae bacterium]MBP7683585.1 protein kinase [Deltaproteobacteria bacterium]